MNLMINYSSKWWYKLITVILVIALILYFSIGFAPKASAVVVSTVIVGSVLAAMAATGIGLAVSGMTSEELTQWVSDKLNDWTSDIGGSIQDHIDNNLLTVTAGGLLSIGSAAAQGISDFISWLVNDESLTDNTNKTLFLNTTVIKMDSDIYYSIAKWDTTYLSLRPKTNYGPLYVVMAKNGIYTGSLVATNNVNGHYASYWAARDDNSYVAADYSNYTSQYSTLNNNTIVNNINLYYDLKPSASYGGITISNVAIYETLQDGLNAIAQAISSDNYGDSLIANTGVISIPTIEQDDTWVINVGADAGEDVDTVTDGVISDTITNTLEVTDEIVEASNVQEVVIVNEDAIAVNVDHHIIGFTNLPDFAHLNLNSIWHYVSDAVDFASSWLAWFVSFLTAMPLLAIPLYMSFTLLVVLSFLRRFI